MIRYLAAALRAHIAGQFALFLLTVSGVALGVAAVFSIHLLNRSAVNAFAAAMTAVHGDVDLSVLPAGEALDERLYPWVLADPAVLRATPVVEGTVRVAADPPLFLDLVGTDLLQPGAAILGEGDGPKAADVAAPGFVAITRELAGTRGWAVGDRLEVSAGTRRTALTIGAIADLRARHPLVSDRTAVVDVAVAQETLWRLGRLDRIDVWLREGADAEQAARRLEERLEATVRVLTPAQRSGRSEGLLEAFRVNLTALSVVSLLVGLFLVNGSVQAALLRRRTEFGVLRSLGASRAQVFGQILAEVALLALPGVAAGLWLGYRAAAANLASVSGTIRNLYLLEEVERLHAPWTLFAAAAGIGLLGALLGALSPAWSLARDPPLALLGAGAHHDALRRRAFPLAGLALAALALVAAWYAVLGRHWRPAGFVLGAAVILAIPGLSPALLRAVADRLRPRGFGVALAWQGLGRRLRTAAMAVASLAVAVSMLFGLTLMLASFRRTVELWLHTSFAADVYVGTASGSRDAANARIAPDVVEELAAFPGVRAIDRVRRFQAWVGDRRLTVLGADLHVAEARARFPLLDGDPDAVFAQVREGAVLLSEPAARKLGLDAGDSIDLPAAGGTRRFRVAGVFYDYTSELGSVVLDLARMQQAFGEQPVNGAALYLHDPAQAAAVEDALRARFAGQSLVFNRSRDLHDEGMRVFDQTFLITRLVQVLSLVIAACGVALALLVIGREGASEVALLRSLGARRVQVARYFLRMGVLIGAAGVVLGTLGGAALAWILVYGVNRAYFGWTIQVHAPSWPLLQQVATIAAAVVLASLYPALRASRIPATELTRERV